MENRMKNLLKYSIWRRFIAYAQRIYIVLRRGATIISVAVATFNACKFVLWMIDQLS
jgi:hypothetical protein